MTTKKKLPYFPLYVNDFIGDTQDLTNEELGAYFRILLYSWGKGRFELHRTKFICQDDEIWSAIEQYFEEEDGLWFNAKLERVREQVADKVCKRSEAGKAGAKARWDGKGNAIANGEGNGKQYGKTIASQSLKLKVKSLEAQSSKTKEKREPQKRFHPPLYVEVLKRMIDPSLKNHLDQSQAEREADAFVNFYTSNGWKVGKNKMVSWHGAVGTWLLRLEKEAIKEVGYIPQVED